LKTLLKTCHITEEEFCDWYFTEEAWASSRVYR
jgi:hypothetical protein